MSMTYSLFEWVRESLDTLLTNQPETLQTVCDDLETKLTVDTSQDDAGGRSKVKKEQLSKAQKRSLWKKGGVNEDDRERGWNWVDIVRHLSQSGGGGGEDSWRDGRSSHRPHLSPLRRTISNHLSSAGADITSHFNTMP